MRQGDPLGLPRGPRRVEDDGQVGVGPVQRGNGVRLPGDDAIVGERTRRLAADQDPPALPTPGLPVQLGRGDHDGGRGVLQDVPHLGRAQEKGDRDDDRPKLEDRGVALEHLRAVREQHHNAVAWSDPQPAEGVREPVGGPLLLDVSPLPPLEHEGGILAEPPDVLLAEGREVHAAPLTWPAPSGERGNMGQRLTWDLGPGSPRGPAFASAPYPAPGWARGQGGRGGVGGVRWRGAQRHSGDR